MTKGLKIALGCGAAGCLVVAGVAAVVVFGVGAGAHWLKGKTEAFVGQEKEIDALRKKADAVPFDAPSDGVIREDRLLAFLEIRKRVFAVYEKNRPYFEGMKDRKDPSLSDLGTGMAVLNEVRLTQHRARADVGMSEAEYAFLVQAVYQSAWAAAWQKDDSRPASEALDEAMKQMGEAMEKGLDAARKEGVPGATDLSDETVRKAREEMQRAAESMKKLDAPPANVELFRKHEAEIKKYAMHGLELLGL